MHSEIKLDYVSAVTNIVCWSKEGSPFQDRYALVYFFSLLKMLHMKNVIVLNKPSTNVTEPEKTGLMCT